VKDIKYAATGVDHILTASTFRSSGEIRKQGNKITEEDRWYMRGVLNHFTKIQNFVSCVYVIYVNKKD
jgi:hypothetical protein